MFLALDFFYHLVGNFGLAILLVTVLVKTLFFPLANKSYASMAKMKSVQPQLAALKERYPDDKVKQQQEMMEIYKKEKINPIAGCLPVALQIPVFFSLYKVLFVTIEMRHAPFFGWIKDLSSPDPTNLFTLFGLFNYDPTQLPLIGHYLALGVWPMIMGVTMWFQMKLNPTPPDPTQKMIFDWMPLIFTFMLAGFPGGPGDLLGMEQHPVGAAAELHHAPQRREGRTVRQSSGYVRLEEGDVEKSDGPNFLGFGVGRTNWNFVMPGLVPGIHVLRCPVKSKTWMAGTSPAMTRKRKPSHDRRTRCEADRAGTKAVRRRLAIRLGLALDRNAARRWRAWRSPLPAAPMSASPA